MNQRVRLTFRAGATARVRSVWAEVLKPQSVYRVVDKYGDWGRGGREERIVLTAADIVQELPAEEDRKYGVLVVSK